MSTLDAKPQPLAPSETRKFGYVLFASSMVAGAVWTGLIFLISNEWKLAIFYYFLVIGGSLSLLCITIPKKLQPVHRGWLRVTKILEKAVTCVLLTTFFYLILTPVAFCLRLFGHKPFIKRGNKDTSSYWEPTETPPKPERYYRQY